MTGKAGWIKGSVLAAALLASGVAVAQGYQPRQSDPQEQDDWPDDAQPSAPDDSESQAAQPRADDDFSDVAAKDPNQSDSDPRDDRLRRQDAVTQAEPEEDEDAITSCALAAREEAERDGGYAEVRQVQEPRETRNGYDVEGDIEVRSGWRTQDGRSRHFTCSIQNGRIANVYVRREPAPR
ncbi:hypothetical protein [Sphingobium sp. EP60837]|jgi:hypothetical protein|uniref:hypothetical protein n=1 Tax=Sphingobium sp. EP60837 TaxID=1855519 RepID=UPI0007DCE1D8|nr:hypothetical protein [Sphingobium sp. EP60837]ANI77680.1 hypothetical protein EP837_01250 [Sphingobium sp. EP60837]